MAIGVCRECEQKVSSEAPTCPKCGAVKPFKEKRIGVFGYIGVGFVGLVAFTMCSPKADVPATQVSNSTPAQPIGKTLQQIETENRVAISTLDPKQIRAVLSDKLLAVCQRSSPNLNYIKAEVRGNSIFCVHSFYSQHSLSIGSLARYLEQFINEWQSELKSAEIKRVGTEN